MHEFSFHYPWHNAPKAEAPRSFSFDWNAAQSRDANREAIARLVVKPDVPPVIRLTPNEPTLGYAEVLPPQEVKPHVDPAFRCDRCHCARRRADLRPAPEPR